MMKSITRKHPGELRKQGGMMLLEGLLAILIFSFGILAIVGLQSSALRYTTDAKYRLDASFLANQSIALMWTNRTSLDVHEVTDEDIISLPQGKRTIAVTGNDVTVTITWKLPGEVTAHKYVVTATING